MINQKRNKEVIILLDKVDMEQFIIQLKNALLKQIILIKTKTELQNSSCSSCKSKDIIVTDQDAVDYLALLAAKTGTSLEVISGVTEYGSMLASLGKIGAILRYNPNYSN